MNALEPTVEALGVSELFIGIIVILLIGNLAEHVVGVTLAGKNKMDFSLITSIESGDGDRPVRDAQPRVLRSAVGNPLTLVFTPLEVVGVASASSSRPTSARRALELGRGAPAHERLSDIATRLLLPDLGDDR